MTTTFIDQQDWFEVGAGGAHQVEAVRDRSRHHVLVRQHHPVGGIAQFYRGEYPALHQPSDHLLVDIDGRLVVAQQGAVGQPGNQPRGRVVVRTPAANLVRSWENQTYDVVRVELLEVGSAVGVDDVVRRARHCC
jgi:hypothetical protein